MTEVFLDLLKLACLMMSNFGYYNLLRKKTDLHISFIPLVTIGIQITILFCGGILNLLLSTSLIMLAAGVLLFAMDLCHKKTCEYRKFADFSYAYMGICVLVLFFCLQGKYFTHFDDFSHWANAVQELTAYNAFPNFRNWMLHFKTYPLGSTTYIYYCCLLAGTGESTQMLIQAFMMVCAVMPLFSCIHKHRLWTTLYLLIFTNFLFVYNIQLASLLVDTLLPLVGMGAFLITHQILHKERIAQERNYSDIWVLGPLYVMTVMIKNSGLFFALPSMILAAASRKKKPQRNLLLAAEIFMPIFSMLIWRRHCTYVFQDAAISKHTVSFENYMQIFAEKSVDDIISIGRRMGRFLLVHPGLICIFILLLAIVGISLRLNKKQLKRSLKFLAMIMGMYFLYSAGVYGMYVFSMPLAEAEYLVEVFRYIGTIDIACFYLITAYALSLLDQVNGERKFACAFAAVLAVLILVWGGLTHWKIVSQSTYPGPRKMLDQRIEEYHIPIGAACVICNSTELSDEYWANAAGFLLRSSALYREDDFTAENIDMLKTIPYIIMLDYDNDMMNQWILNQYPEQYGNSVIVTK